MNSIRDAWNGLRKPVFIPAILIIAALILFAVIYGSSASDAFTSLRNSISHGIGWWYILSATGFVVFAGYCAFSRVGNIKLGRDDETPEFGVVSWFAMLFSAGMGIGLVFYGVGEPLSHFVKPPQDSGVAPSSVPAAANQAMDLTLFHWGFHAWAIYVVVGLGLAYMTYRKGRPLSVRWLLEPLLGRARIEGAIGHAIDIIAIVGTLFGVATSLGFGVQQISAGLEYLGWVETTNWLVILLIAGVTGIAIFSVVSGVSKGLKWLSNINMGLAAALALFVLILGPTLFLMQSWVRNLGGYLSSLPSTMLQTWPFASDGWAEAWTIFYWGWWMSWAPFVGMFIARISRGRTIREFIAGVILAPTVVASVWFTIFGGSGILRQIDATKAGDAAAKLANPDVNVDTTLFQLLGGLPLGVITSVLAILVVVFFFVTSADSGALVIDILATGGNLETSKITRVFWTVLEGVAAAALLLVGGTGSLVALQTASIATAIPFSIVLVLACISMVKAFRYDVATTPRYMRISTPGAVAEPAAMPPALSGAQARAAASRLRTVSTTMAGLTPSHGPAPAPAASTDRLVAVHEVPMSALEVDPDTGVVGYVEHQDISDPLRGEVFDSPEFEQSAEGQAPPDDTVEEKPSE